VLRCAPNPCPLRQDRAPWPPSLLRQAPTQSRRASPSFPAIKRFPTEILYPSRLPTPGGPLYGFTAPVASDVLRYARYPCPFGLEQNLLAASIPAPGLSSHRVVSPGASRLSPQLWFPSHGLSPHGSWTRVEPFYYRLAVAVPRPAKVCRLPLNISAVQSPLAAYPTSTRYPAAVSQASHSDLSRHRVGSFSSRLLGLRWAYFGFDTAETLRRTLVCTLPLTDSPGQRYRV
jgi:hypothetical protein